MFKKLFSKKEKKLRDFIPNAYDNLTLFWKGEYIPEDRIHEFVKITKKAKIVREEETKTIGFSKGLIIDGCVSKITGNKTGIYVLSTKWV